MSIDNHGVGPAVLESVIIKYNNEVYDLVDYNNEVLTFLKSKVPELDSLKIFSFSKLDKGMEMTVNQSYNVFQVKDSKED